MRWATLDYVSLIHQLPGVRNMVGPINKRLGYRNKTLSVRSVKLMWDICRYEMSWYPEDTHDKFKSWPWLVECFTNLMLLQVCCFYRN